MTRACLTRAYVTRACVARGVVLAVGIGVAIGAAVPFAGFVGPAAAQSLGEVVAPKSPILILDQDKLFAGSAYGKRVQAEIEAESKALVSENRRIEAELTGEESALTEKRPELTPDQFRKLADAFDQKVVELRRQQDTKTRNLQRRGEQERQLFLQTILPILSEIVAESGAMVVLDSRSVFMSSDRVDITDVALQRIDARIGDGAALPGIVPEAVPLSGGTEAGSGDGTGDGTEAGTGDGTEAGTGDGAGDDAANDAAAPGDTGSEK